MTSWCNRLWQFVTARELEGLGETFYFFGGAGAILALLLYCFLREPARGAADRAGSVSMAEESTVTADLTTDRAQTVVIY